jgi:malate dehydrogenase (oxaloacetate-decarboxylating)(NADP+)
MALANPTPEIMPDEARKARPDAMICTGRSDFPNQVNNVLCFPFIFRGALDVGATAINEDMKHAAVGAIAQLAREPPSDAIAPGFDSGEVQGFGPGSQRRPWLRGLQPGRSPISRTMRLSSSASRSAPAWS